MYLRPVLLVHLDVITTIFADPITYTGVVTPAGTSDGLPIAAVDVALRTRHRRSTTMTHREHAKASSLCFLTLLKLLHAPFVAH